MLRRPPWRQEPWLCQTNEAWAKDKEQRDQRLEGIQKYLASRAASAPGGSPQWYVNGQGQTMVVFPGPIEFAMGSPLTEAGRFPQEIQHCRRIGRTFAIATKPVTVEQFLRFRKDHDYLPQYAPTNDCPVHDTT